MNDLARRVHAHTHRHTNTHWYRVQNLWPQQYDGAEPWLHPDVITSALISYQNQEVGQIWGVCIAWWNLSMQPRSATLYSWLRCVSECCVLSRVRLSVTHELYSSPGSSVHGIIQTRILEGVAISFSRESSQPRDQTCVSCIGRQILYHWAT